MEMYDAVVVGFGKAGKTLAVTLAKAGWNVAIIEQSAKMYGGTCINIACIPTKTLLHDATMPPSSAVTSAVRYEDAIGRKDDVTAQLRNKNFRNLDDSSNVTVYTGHARFVGTHEIEITAGSETLVVRSAKMFINTGTEPRIPPIDGVENSPIVYTSTSLMDLTDLPKRLVIIGGGKVGLEFASMYQQFGADVTVLSRGDRLLDHEDSDVIAAVKKELDALGVQFVFNANVKRIEDLPRSARIAFESEAGLTKIEAEAVLFATGEPPTWNYMTVGFAEGLHSVRPDAKLVYAIVGEAAYDDAPNAKRVTETVLAGGADIVFGMGDGASFGMIQAIREFNANRPPEEHARFIDVIGDKSDSEAKDFLLTSVLFDYTGVYTQLVSDLEVGQFGSVVTMTVANDGVRLLDPPIPVDPAHMQQVDETRDQIINGEIHVSVIGDADGTHQRLNELFPNGG